MSPTAPGDHLVGGPERELVAIPRRDRSRAAPSWQCDSSARGVGGIELHRRGGEGAREIADRGIRRRRRIRAWASMPCPSPRRDRRLPSPRHTSRAPDAPPRAPARTFPRRPPRSPGDSAGSPGPPSSLRGVEFALAELAGVLRGHDGDHARRGLGRGEVHRSDAALGDGRADDVTVRLVRRHVVPLVGVGRGAGGFQRTIDAIDGFADHLQLVDRIGRWRECRISWLRLLSLPPAPRPARVRPA